MNRADVLLILDEKFAKKVTDEYKKRTGYSNVIGSVSSNMKVFIPIIKDILDDGLRVQEENEREVRHDKS